MTTPETTELITVSQSLPDETLLHQLRDPVKRKRLEELGWSLEELDAAVSLSSQPTTTPP